MGESTLGRINSYNSLKHTIQQDKNIKSDNNSRHVERSVFEKYQEDIKDLTNAIRLFPEDYTLYFNRATLKVHIGDIEGARSDFRMSENYHRDINLEFEYYPLV